MPKMTDEQKIREARNAYMRDYRKKNRKKIAAYEKKWRQENPEKVAEYKRKHWLKKAEERKRKVS